MKRRLIGLAERVLPDAALRALRAAWHRIKQRRYFQQGSSTIVIGDITLEIPANHPLPGLMKACPNRDGCVGIIAKFAAAKYPKAAIIDIGANIGDTAAIIAEQCANRLVLVEASDYFFEFLRKNAAKLKNQVDLRKTFVGDGKATAGELFHWGGTAEWKETPGSKSIPTQGLGTLTAESVCFLKTDTDGQDFKILLSGMDWLAQARPVILSESQIRNSNDLEQLDRLLGALGSAGYDGFIAWDDAGIHAASTSDPEVIKDLNRYALRSIEQRSEVSVSNFDLAFFHGKDRDIFEEVSNWYRK